MCTEDQLDAVAKHYGFKSELLDFTFSLTIAAFFALNETKSEYHTSYQFPHVPDYKCGAIWKIPIYSYLGPKSPIRLITLPPIFSRPNHQYGVFVYGKSAENSAIKYTFDHVKKAGDIEHDFLDFLPDLGPFKPTNLESYLMPLSDVLRLKANEILVKHEDPTMRQFSEINTFNKWIWDLCEVTTTGDVPVTNIEIALQLCKENPKQTKLAIQKIIEMIPRFKDPDKSALESHLCCLLGGYILGTQDFDYLKTILQTTWVMNLWIERFFNKFKEYLSKEYGFKPTNHL